MRHWLRVSAVTVIATLLGMFPAIGLVPDAEILEKFSRGVEKVENSCFRVDVEKHYEAPGKGTTVTFVTANGFCTKAGFVTVFHAVDGMHKGWVRDGGEEYRVKGIRKMHKFSDVCLLDAEIPDRIKRFEVSRYLPRRGESLALVFLGTIISVDTVIDFHEIGYLRRPGEYVRMPVIRMKGTLRRGQSGCPLLNQAGEVAGMAAFGIRLPSGKLSPGEYLVIPGRVILDVLEME